MNTFPYYHIYFKVVLGHETPLVLTCYNLKSHRANRYFGQNKFQDAFSASFFEFKTFYYEIDFETHYLMSLKRRFPCLKPSYSSHLSSASISRARLQPEVLSLERLIWNDANSKRKHEYGLEAITNHWSTQTAHILNRSCPTFFKYYSFVLFFIQNG